MLGRPPPPCDDVMEDGTGTGGGGKGTGGSGDFPGLVKFEGYVI